MTVKEKLRIYNQEHLLKFEKELSENEKIKLHKQISEIDFSYLKELNKAQRKNEDVVSSLKTMTLDEIEESALKFEKVGFESLKRQEVAVLLLAGGMGTRLGSDNPKGMFNIGKTREVFIFQRLFENTLKVVEKCGKKIPFFIMTSEKNNDATVRFLKDKNFFGYDENYVRFFVQEMAPCVDLNGKVLLEEKGRIATSPNGNGGWFNSLVNNLQARQMLEKFNIKWINLFGVDNVLQSIADPVFIGATLSGNYEVGTKVIRKVSPDEKVGVVCRKNGKPSVIDYVDLSEEMACEVDENGERIYNFGVILNYLFSVDLLYKTLDQKLPVHIVKKKVEFVDDQGILNKPSEPNAYKFELLCVDMVEFAGSCLPFEVVREKEFAPIKNKTGIDSVESAQALLEKNGYKL